MFRGTGVIVSGRRRGGRGEDSISDGRRIVMIAIVLIMIIIMIVMGRTATSMHQLTARRWTDVCGDV
jgi:hypothetical protein